MKTKTAAKTAALALALTASACGAAATDTEPAPAGTRTYVFDNCTIAEDSDGSDVAYRIDGDWITVGDADLYEVCS